MDIFFQDPTDIPLPPEEVRVRRFQIQPWPDGRRVKVILELTPFQKRPNAEVSVTGLDGNEVASISIIETMVAKMEFTLHLRGPKPEGPFTAAATIFYLEEPEDAGEDPEAGPDERQQIIVDRAETTFEIQASES